MTIDVQPGQMLAGKYSVERVLGKGGMGLVIAAKHVQLDEHVAIKLMLPEMAMNPDAVARFVREARAAAKIKNEHVARVSDVGVLENGQPYMVMEYLEGSDLGAVLAAQHRVPVEDAVEYLLQASEAIAEAHAIGIVHRDLKPANLFMIRRRDGVPLIKVLDFGISKVSNASGQSDGAMTRTSALMGSPLYMSPEQMTSSRNVDARSDVWALGVILYELISGSTPFNAETLPQVCALVMEARVPPLRERVPDIHPELEAVIHRCLMRDPGARFRDVAELSRALLPFASRRARASVERITSQFGAPGQSLPPSTDYGASAMTAPGGSTNAAWGETRPPGVPGKRAWPLVVGFVVLLAGSAIAFVALRSSSDDETALPESSSATADPRSAAPPPPPPVTVAPPEPVAPPPPPAATPSAAPSPPQVAKPTLRPTVKPATTPPKPATVTETAKPTPQPVAVKPLPTKPAPPKNDLGGRL
jgi:serine/threonine-protein kinase